MVDASAGAYTSATTQKRTVARKEGGAISLPVVILHGYAGQAKDWKGLGDALEREHGGPVSHVYLGEFSTKEDDLVYGDLSEGFDRDLRKLRELGKLAPRSFSIVAHSTGALVVRHWLQRYYGDRPDKIPLKHLILLAPANFGSRLAHHGNAAYGRLINFLKDPVPEGWETGRHILDGLELASPFTWDMAMNDVLKGAAGQSPYLHNAEGFYTFVIVGNQPFTDRVQRRFPPAAEPGSDGTVRLASAALNSRRLRFDFAQRQPSFTAVDGYSRVPLAAVRNVNHNDIKHVGKYRKVLDLVLQALRVDSDESFDAAAAAFRAVTKRTLDGREDDHLRHEYQQIITRVSDDAGEPVRDYNLDFEVLAGDAKKENTKLSDAFNATRKHVHTYTGDSSYRCFFVDYTELKQLSDRLPRGQNVYLSLVAKDLSRKVSYDSGQHRRVPLWGPATAGQEVKFFFGTTTTLVDIIIDRTARDDLFEIRPN